MKRLMLICLLILTGCGGDSGADVPSTVRPGGDIFEQRILGPNPGCITCHSFDPDTTLVGPSIAGVGTRAATRVGAQSARDYLRASIITPSAFIVEGFDDGKMPADWAEILTEAEVEALVDYLLTLR